MDSFFLSVFLSPQVHCTWECASSVWWVCTTQWYGICRCEVLGWAVEHQGWRKRVHWNCLGTGAATTSSSSSSSPVLFSFTWLSSFNHCSFICLRWLSTVLILLSPDSFLLCIQASILFISMDHQQIEQIARREFNKCSSKFHLIQIFWTGLLLYKGHYQLGFMKGNDLHCKSCRLQWKFADYSDLVEYLTGWFNCSLGSVGDWVGYQLWSGVCTHSNRIIPFHHWEDKENCISGRANQDNFQVCRARKACAFHWQYSFKEEETCGL